MKDSNEPIDAVRRLIKAENDQDSDAAAREISENFIAINRSDGRRQRRDGLLKEIGDKEKEKVLREMVGPVDIIAQSQEFAVASSLIQVKLKKFRNTHVLQNEDGQWRSISWQVTEEKS
jgi:hypothetical protein